MRSLRMWLLVASLPIVPGCSFLALPTILSEQPLGDIAVLKPEDWNGLWVAPNGKYAQLRVADAEKGLLEGMLDAPSDPCNGATREKTEVSKSHAIRRSGNWFFPYEPGPGGRLYENVLVMLRNQDALIVFLFDTGRARTLIEQGQLPGRIERSERSEYDQVILGHLSAEHHRTLFPDELTDDEKNGKERLRPPVLWRPLFVMVKLPPGIDPCKTSNQGK